MTHQEDGFNIGRGGMPFDVRAPLSEYRPPSTLGNNIAYFASPGQPGAPTTVENTYNVVPPAAGNAVLASGATVSGAAFTLFTGTGITTTTHNGILYYDLGCPRCLLASGAGAGTVSTPLNVVGLDEYFQPQTQSFAGPVSNTIVTTLKAFRYVQSVSAVGNTVGNVSIGVSDILGLPFRIDTRAAQCYAWNDVWQTASTGVTVADTTSPATSVTGDVRGTVALPTTSSNGVARFVSSITVFITDKMDNIYGVIPA